MADDSVRRYLDARRELEQATRRAEQVTGVIISVASLLRDWRTTHVSNVRAGFPPELMGRPAINANEWPTAEELADGLSDWHKAANAARSAWAAVPEPDRQGLQPPPR